MRHIILKEIRDYLYNPRAIITIFATAVLVLIALYNGYAAYRTFDHGAREGDLIAREIAAGSESFEELGREGIAVTRQPDRLMIFDIGTTGVIGSKSTIAIQMRPRPRDSRYGADPVLATFGELDITFIVSIILSLFALLYSYNLVSGERESGTLRMIAANSIKRSSIIIGKIVGAFTSLALSFLLPLLLGIIVLLAATEIRFSGEEWLRIGLMILVSLLYLFTFFLIGTAVSTLTRTSSISFLICLVIWIISVALIPRLAVHAAELISPSWSIDEVNSKTVSYRRNMMLEYGRHLKEYFDDHDVTYVSFATEMGNSVRYAMNKIAVAQFEFENSLYTETGHKRAALLDSARTISLLSPTCSFTFAAHTLANTGPESIQHFEQDLLRYRETFKSFIESRPLPPPPGPESQLKRLGIEFPAPQNGPIRLKYVKRQPPPKLELAELPRFRSSVVRPDIVLGGILVNVAALLFVAILLFSIAFVAFIRYDVR